MVEIRNWPIKLSALRPEKQIIASQTLLKTARLDQVASYYRLLCEQLDEVRCYIAHELTIHRENDKRLRQVIPIFFSRQDDVAKSSKVKKAAHAVQTADKKYRLRAGYRAFARGLEMLIEKCEVRLQKRKIGPEEVDVHTIDTAKAEEIGSRKLRAQYARSFPRGADRRLATYALEDPEAGEIVRAEGTDRAGKGGSSERHFFNALHDYCKRFYGQIEGGT
ncbi:MAG: hypothetical protein Q9161_006164 [Pseudevernia consocians]